MHQLLHFTTVAAVALTLTAEVSPQRPERADDDIRVVVGGSEVHGQAARYDARFGTESFEYTPRAPDAVPLRFTLEAVGRRNATGDAAWTDAGRGTRTNDERTVRYERATCVERYELRAEGVEQSFAFATLPTGAGDLVVRGRLATALPLVEQSQRGLLFARDGAPAIAFGAVTGIDANGQTAAGALRVVGDRLELSLPASFVERAALPLVLDPLVGSAFDVASSSQDGDVAYNGNQNMYCVVWDYAPLLGTGAIRAQRYTAAGAAIGSVITVKSSSTPVRPRVASVGSLDTFIVVWEESGDIRAAGVSTGGALLAETVVAGGTDAQITPAIGGDADDRGAVVVWENDTQNKIEAASVVASLGTLLVGVPTTIIAGNTAVFRFVSNPAISSAENTTDRHLVAWEQRTSLISQTSQIVARPVTSFGGLLGSTVTIADTSLYRTSPAVDGDGVEWMVAWENGASASATDHDIAVCTVAWDPNASNAYVKVIERVIEGDVNDDEIEPSVIDLGASFLVGYADATGTGYDAYAESIDPAACTNCEGEFLLQAGSRTVGGAGRYGGGDNLDEALLAWRLGGAGFQGTVRAVRFDAQGVGEPSVTASCGKGGFQRATCAVLGHSAFQLRLQGAVPSQAVVLALSPQGLPIFVNCNGCVIGADPFRGVVVSPGTTDARGDAAVAVPIPSTIPVAQFYNLFTQWFVLNPGGQCSLGFEMSNTLGLIIL